MASKITTTQSIKFRLEYAPFWLLAQTVRILPRTTALRLGKRLG
ncbi:MAG: hypothetical protein P8X63_12645 [Desulfuromonadaceae bacterium]